MTDYRVLARKYRPSRFSEVIGQDVLVRTLTNAIATSRIAHAFLLTGIRGVGKTTTARIIARALNCIGPDGNGKPTAEPCGVCTHCTMIAEDRHTDVLEMDAASRTGVADIRELIDTVHYLPSAARYKIYIIDEVHMLSASAFNALLKTLEEPPPHVKFIFATTEIRKIPVTILSRCQRFDLKRVDVETLSTHLSNVAKQENAPVDDESLQIIALAAEGSVRDALSLLDQAISHSAGENQPVSASLVRGMLGLADRSQSFELLEPLLAGEIKQALDVFAKLYDNGADPTLLLQDMLEMVHFVTRLRLVPELSKDPAFSEGERTRGTALAEKLSIPMLSQAWQMLLKGVQEVRQSPNPHSAAEMVLVRIAYAAELPSPADLIRAVQEGSAAVRATSSAAGKAAVPVAKALPPASVESRTPIQMVEVPAPASDNAPASFEAVVAMFGERKEAILYSHLKQHSRLVSYAPGKIEIATDGHVPPDFTSKIIKCLNQWTGMRWMVSLSKQPGEPTLAEQENVRKQQALEEAARHPAVASVLEHFPGATVTKVQNSA